MRLRTLLLCLFLTAGCKGCSVDESPQDSPSEQARIHAKFRTFFGERPAVRPDPQLEIIERSPLPSTTRLRVRYWVEADERIDAYVFLPTDTTQKVPGVLAFHQTGPFGMSETAGLAGDPSMAYGLELANAGFAVITFDDVTTGERLQPGMKPFETAAFYRKHPNWSILDKAVWDGEQAITVLCQFKAVDCSRIGVVGHSQGGVYSWLLAGDDVRVKATVVNCGFTTLQGDPEPERWARESWYIALPALRPYLVARNFPFEWTEYLALIPPRALALLISKSDEVIPNTMAAALAVGTLEPHYVTAPDALAIKEYPGKHEFPAGRHETMIGFFRQNL